MTVSAMIPIIVAVARWVWAYRERRKSRDVCRIMRSVASLSNEELMDRLTRFESDYKRLGIGPEEE
jgi:hypothetical protein